MNFKYCFSNAVQEEFTLNMMKYASDKNANNLFTGQWNIILEKCGQPSAFILPFSKFKEQSGCNGIIYRNGIDLLQRKLAPKFKKKLHIIKSQLWIAIDVCTPG